MDPVWDGSFADPFVLRAEGAYYAYGTGSVLGGRVFEVLRSTDLLRWRSLGGALEPPPGLDATDYWAPEVAVLDARYCMYYSAGIGDVGHRLRVATSDDPAGPFVDAGAVLTPDEPFAIDPNPFRDLDGAWYLYFARDELASDRPGTVIAVDRLVSPTRLAGSPQTILRATADWQLFRRDRLIYGAVYDWYTLEGPCVVRRDGRYWCLYSGGAWDGDTYGVSYASARHPLGPFTEPPDTGAAALLRTVPGRLLGPGHNSLVTDDAGDDHLVYHAWDPALTRRRMHISRLHWGPNGPLSPAAARPP